MKSYLLIIWFSISAMSQENLFPADSLVYPWKIVSTSNKISPTSLPVSQLFSGANSSKSAIYSQNGKIITINICDYGTATAAGSLLSIAYSFFGNNLIGRYPDTTFVFGYLDSAMLIKWSGKYYININTDTLPTSIEQARQMELIVINNINSIPVKYFLNRKYTQKNRVVDNRFYFLDGKLLGTKRSYHFIVKANVIIL